MMSFAKYNEKYNSKMTNNRFSVRSVVNRTTPFSWLGFRDPKLHLTLYYVLICIQGMQKLDCSKKYNKFLYAALVATICYCKKLF